MNCKNQDTLRIGRVSNIGGNMSKFLSTIGLVLLLNIPLNAFAGGYSGWFIPEEFELLGNGVLIKSKAIKDVNGCGRSGIIFIGANDPRKEQIQSLFTSAIMAKRRMKVYLGSCTSVPFHFGSGKVINQLLAHHPVFFK